LLTRIDHVVIGVPDVALGTEAFTQMGFEVDRGDAGSRDLAFAFLDPDFLQLSSAERPGLRLLVVESDDLAADVAAMRNRGVDVGDPVEHEHHTISGRLLRWKLAMLGSRDALPVAFAQWLVARPAPGAHPNRATRLERAYLAVADLGAASRHYGQVLGLPVPRVQRGTVIKADMAVFDLGPTGLTVAEPAEPGPAAEALARQGDGPFQVLYRTLSMDAAGAWIVDHGQPPPARGVRNTGEQAMLVGPENACGSYVGFVGAP
jgi:hypothetical protein